MSADQHNPAIKAFAHCRQCIRSMPQGESPRTWARIEVGLTNDGAVVWCVRHDAEIVTIEFEKPIEYRESPEGVTLIPAAPKTIHLN